MRLVKRLLALGVTGWVMLLTAAAIGAQPAAMTCGELVRLALDSANGACNEVERNQACYGNVAGAITPRNLSMELEWDAVGDRVNLADVAGLVLSPLNEETGQWGVAVMSVQASLPDTLPGQNVTMLMFGNLSIDDAATDPTAKPMQAFYFKTGLGSPECAEAPSNGIMVQTPKGVGLIELTINGVKVSLGSTALLTAPPTETGSKMRVTLLEGRGLVESNGVRRVVVPGSQTEITFDEEGLPVGEPSELTAYDAEDFLFYDGLLDDLDVDLPELGEDFDQYLATISEDDWDTLVGEVIGTPDDGDTIDNIITATDEPEHTDSDNGGSQEPPPDNGGGDDGGGGGDSGGGEG